MGFGKIIGGNETLNMDDVIKIVTGIIAGFGGFSALIIFVVKFLTNMIASNLSEKYSLKMNKELEKYKGTLESQRYISKAMFDKEFAIYESFNKVYADLYNDILMYDRLKNNPDKIITNKDLIKFIEGISFDKNFIEGKFTEQQVQELADKIGNAIFQFRNLLAYAGAFIPHENWKLYQELCNACHNYMLTEDSNALQEIKLSMGKMQTELRSYLVKLIVE